MKDSKPAAVAVEPCIRFTPTEVARNKKSRDDRRRLIRAQNARSKTMR